MLISVNIFSDQWTTDGKDNLEKMEGLWKDNINAVKYLTIKIDNEWFVIVIVEEYKEVYGAVLEKYKTGMFQLKGYEGTYFAWDTKDNTMIVMDESDEIYKLIKLAE